MLLTNTKERADLNDGQPHTPRKATVLHLMLALQQVRAHSPIKTLRVKK